MTDQTSRFVVAVVDDDQSILQSLEYLLESADYAVRLFASATAFLVSGCLPEIDCLISDLGMPGMNGFDLLRTVQSARPELPLILITGRPELLDQMPPFGLRRYRLFKKPFDAEALLTAISEIDNGSVT